MPRTTSRPFHHRDLQVGAPAVLLLAVLFTVSACRTPDPHDPTGKWLELATENVTQETFVECPGESGSLSCGTVTLELADNAKLDIIQTTDEASEPAPWRAKGTWSVADNRLTLILTDEGPTADSLVPIDPPKEEVFVYTVSGDALALSAENDQGDTIISTYLLYED